MPILPAPQDEYASNFITGTTTIQNSQILRGSNHAKGNINTKVFYTNMLMWLGMHLRVNTAIDLFKLNFN